MVIGKSAEHKVYWVGAPDPNVYVPKLASKECYFYKKCIYGPMTLNIGDHVLICCADSVDSDTVENCEIARIIHLYEVEGDPECTDPYQALVQWYSRPNKVPHRLFDNDTICVDFNLEIIEDYRAYDPVISIETILRKCSVVCGSPIDSASSLLANIKDRYPMFVCRYKIIKVGTGHKLIPLSQCVESRRVSSETPKRERTRQTTKSSSKRHSSPKKPKLQNIEFVDLDLIDDDEKPKDVVSPIKIVRNSVLKLRKVLSAEKQHKNPAKMELNANYLVESPDIHKLKTNSATKLSGARRNLNLSLEANSTTDFDVLNYSIIQNSPSKEQSTALKIKLRLSDNQKESNSISLNEELHTSQPAQRSRRVSIDTPTKTPSRSTRSLSISADIDDTAPKKDRDSSAVDYPQTPTAKICCASRRKSILKTPSSRHSLVGTPKRNIHLSNIVEEVIFNENASLAESNRTNTPRRSRKINDDDNDYVCDEPKTPKQRKNSSTPSSITKLMTPTQRLKLLRSGDITPKIESRVKPSNEQKSDLQEARERLHVSAVPQSLPCREQEFYNIYTFLEGKIQDQCGGCMYISGVPGTGKTATVTGVIRRLKCDVELDKVSEFEFIEINGMRLTEPRQAYVQIYKQLTGKTVSWEHAQSLLEKRFTTPGPRRMPTVLLVDELDILCNRRQDVVYNLLDWPTKAGSRLIVVTIANTMDLPERMLMSKVTSRLGLTRLTFQPYSYKQLQEIVTARLSGSESFKGDAVQLVARKVAAVSGDARRALDICRRATEIAEQYINEETVSMSHVQQALAEMISSAKVQAIKKCSKLEQLFLQAVAAEVGRTGVEETTFLGVYTQMETICAIMGVSVPVTGRALKVCAKLGAERLLICEHSRADIFQKILLNVSTDDIHYALQVKNY